MKIDLHLVSWNRPKMTELTIKAIHRNTNRDNFRLVVLDNGSDDDTPERLQALADGGLIDEYLPIKTNLGLEYARNLLLNNCTQSDYFICVDNDCLPPQETGHRLDTATLWADAKARRLRRYLRANRPDDRYGKYFRASRRKW
jgi:glycosyltransferase involved in cell wall biosynthesis